MKSLYSHLPTCPGVYLMKNAKGMTIYIGKSNNLRARVRSYFVPNATLNFAKKKMVKLIAKIDYIETKSDIEALMLETNLIKENLPKYNVLMKDGKNLSYITIIDDPVPCLIKTRFKKEKGEYFGPYSQYFDTRNYVRFVRKLFRLGNHESYQELLKTKGVPCMDTYLGLCPGHCTGDSEKMQIYHERLEQAGEFLRGKHEEIIHDITHKMQQASEERRYEDALEYKKMIDQIESTGNKQIVRDVIEGDALVVVGLEKYGQNFLSIVEVKNSMTTGVHEYILGNPLDEPSDTVLANAVLQYLGDNTFTLGKYSIFTDRILESHEEFIEYLQAANITIRHPLRGEKVRLLEFAHTNLLNFAYHQAMDGLKKATLGKKDMVSLLDILFGVQKTKDKIQNDKKEIVFECFDISHSHGEHTVASKSVLVNGKPDPKRYKKYRIKTLKTGVIDDFASMEEILTRRTLAALRGENPWPDLIIIDGGKGQLSYATEAIKRHTTDIPKIVSLAKREEEVFLPGQSEPILLEKGSSELMLLQKIRDEAHRFAINYNRSSREKGYTKTIFDELPGIGPVARKKILSHISRVEELQTWTLDKAEKTFGKKTAIILQDHGILQC